MGHSQDDEGGEGQAGQQAATAAAQRAPVGAEAAPASPPAPAVAEAHPGHRHGHGEEQSHGGTDDIAQLVLHHLRHGRASLAPLHRARAAPGIRVPSARWETSPWHPPPHVPAHLRRSHGAGVIQGCPEQLCKKINHGTGRGGSTPCILNLPGAAAAPGQRQNPLPELLGGPAATLGVRSQHPRGRGSPARSSPVGSGFCWMRSRLLRTRP